MLEDQFLASHAIASIGSVALGTTVTYPLDTIKVLIQVGSGSSKQLSPPLVLNRLRSLTGYSGLYSGLCWLTLGRTFGLGARFGFYEILTAFYKDGRKDNYVYVSEALMAGMAAGATESLVASPFELMKVRTQALNHSVGLLSILSNKHPKLNGALQEYPWMMTGSGRPPSVCHVRRSSDIVSLEGWGAFWRGLRSGVVRDSIFGGIFFCSWQFLHRAMLDWKAVGMDSLPRSDEEIGPLSPLAVSLAAGFSGTVAAAASHCFDTAHSRSQCVVLPKYVNMERELLKWKRPGKRFERVTGIHPADRDLLFRGIWLRMARSGLASFMIVGIYFSAVDFLVSR